MRANPAPIRGWARSDSSEVAARGVWYRTISHMLRILASGSGVPDSTRLTVGRTARATKRASVDTPAMSAILPTWTPGRPEWASILYFGLTAFFLVYVPFSKIGHYLYYPFSRVILGLALGHRGAMGGGKP